ncbi:hypothetical protein TCAL_17127 [Tigriopus californicus]|uniref:SET domain-containing protein n=1 Tax=Tigriopus californicus TaxID=6832 RepID=A0A553P2R9_TIGCA|nr:hypothetical protein TCAL_17127 [Tigriopus californicus]
MEVVQRCSLNILQIKISQPKETSPKFRYEKMTSFFAGSQPTVMDPMERMNVYIGNTNMGEGVFAKKDLFPFQLICYYSGLFISHEDAKTMFSNMSLNELKTNSRYLVNYNSTHLLDVPSGNLAQFRSSLGHKVNHSFRPNSRFVHARSPRFGNVTAIESLTFIKRGSEVLISYGYQNISNPFLDWYK